MKIKISKVLPKPCFWFSKILTIFDHCKQIQPSMPYVAKSFPNFQTVFYQDFGVIIKSDSHCTTLTSSFLIKFQLFLKWQVLSCNHQNHTYISNNYPNDFNHLMPWTVLICKHNNIGVTWQLNTIGNMLFIANNSFEIVRNHIFFRQ